MNLPIITAAGTLPMWHLVLESLADGKMSAWIAEWPDCQVVTDGRETAIAALNQLWQARMAMMVADQPREIEVLTCELPIEDGRIITPQIRALLDLPKLDMYDPDFIEFMAALRAERELDDDNPAYTIPPRR
jgi:hypothetical protein